MSTFVPGPWEKDEHSQYVWAEGGQFMICQIRGWGQLTGPRARKLPPEEAIAIQSANADLIAAAPDLLAACEHVVNSPNITVGDRVLLKEVIAEAKGEPV